MVTAIGNAKCAHILEFFAGPYAALAADATAVVLDDGCIEHVDGVLMIGHQVDEHMVAGKHL